MGTEQATVAEIEEIRRSGDSARALELVLDAFERSPADADLLSKTCELLNDWDRFDESMALLGQATGVAEDIVDSLVAETFDAMNRLDDALEIRRRRHESAPDDRKARIAYISALTRVGSFDTARSELRILEERHPNSPYWHLHIAMLNAEQRRLEALDIAEQTLEENPAALGPWRRVLRQFYRCVRKDADPDCRRRADELLQHLTPELLSDDVLLQLAIRLAVALGNEDHAREFMSFAAPDSLLPEVARTHAWLAHVGDDDDEARRIWDGIRSRESLRTTRPCRPGELERIDENLLNDRSNEIRLFTVIRNERWRLPWFLDYYRRLGVDRFFFVDNDSTDGSREWLLTQPDIHVFHTTTSYAIGRSGMVWVNSLMATHGEDAWTIYVDVDEAFVFADIEAHGLRGLTDYMDRKGHDLAAGQMVDMFATEDDGTLDGEFELDFIDKYPYYDPTYERTPTVVCPYYFTIGGIRRLAATGENQTKTPLIRGGRGIQLLGSSHTVTPGVLSDVSVALLHYKLVGDFRADFRDDGEANDRVGECRLRYQAYAETFEQWSGVAPSTAARYASSRSLIDTGVITELAPDFL